MLSTIPPIKTAAELKMGEVATILSIKPTELSIKLIQMGFLPQKKIRLVRTTITGNPLYIQLGEQYIALRKEEAALLIIQ